MTLSDLFVSGGMQTFGDPFVFGMVLLVAFIFIMLLLNMPVGFMLIGCGLITLVLAQIDSSFNIILSIFGVICAVTIVLFFWKMFQSGD